MADGKKEPDQSLVAKWGVDSPNDKCVRHCATRSCYEIIYTNDKGIPGSRSVTGLKVKYTGEDKVKLKAALAKAHEKAKRLWNKMDKSDRPRYLLETMSF